MEPYGRQYKIKHVMFSSNMLHIQYMQDVGTCVWIGCTRPPIPSGKNLRVKGSQFKETLIGVIAEYECFPGFTTVEGLSLQPNLSIECLDGGIWEVPSSWPECPFEARKMPI